MTRDLPPLNGTCSREIIWGGDVDGRIQAVERDGVRLSQQSRLRDLLLGEGLDRSIGLRCYQPLRHARRLARFSGTRTAGLGGYARLMPPYTTGLAT